MKISKSILAPLPQTRVPFYENEARSLKTMLYIARSLSPPSPLSQEFNEL